MEVRDVGPDYGREHSLHGLTLPKRLAELRRQGADPGGLCLFQIPEVINVALRRHEQVPEVRGWISVERGHVEREDDLVINERSAGNVDVPRDLTTHEAVLVGHGRSVIESRHKALGVVRASEGYRGRGMAPETRDAASSGLIAAAGRILPFADWRKGVMSRDAILADVQRPTVVSAPDGYVDPRGRYPNSWRSLIAQLQSLVVDVTPGR